MHNFFAHRGLKRPFCLRRGDPTDKIGLILTGVSLAVILLILSLFVLNVQKREDQEMLATGQTLTRLVASLSQAKLPRGETDQVLQIVNAIAGRRDFVYAMIVDMNGKALIHSDPDAVGTVYTDPVGRQAVASNNPLHQAYTDSQSGARIHELSRPLLLEGQKYGAVRLGFSRGHYPRLAASDKQMLSIVAALVFLLVPIFYYLLRHFLGPLARLNSELQSLLEHNEFNAIEISSNGEIGEVVERFNQVVLDSQQKNREMRTSCEDMEVSNKILSYEKERVDSIIDSLPDGVMVTNSAGNILFVNRSMERLMHVSRAEIVGAPAQECFKDESITAWLAKDPPQGERHSRKNLDITLNRDGEETMMRLSYVPLLSAGEYLLGYMFLAKDVTAQKLAQRSQSEFIAHVSHELRNPLTTIKSYVEILMDGDVRYDGETRIEFFNTISEETTRLARLIENLLNLSKIEMGSLMITRDLLKTREFFEDTVKSMAPQARNKQIKLEAVLPDKLSTLVADKELIRIAILNIIGNAIKYTPEKGAVTFQVEEENHEMKIEISDTGYGISEAEIPSIFEKFFRSKDKNIRQNTGNGLGLALTREIVQLHNGKVEVTSRPGEGTQFTVVLPVEENPRIKGYEGSLGALVTGAQSAG